MLLQQDSQPKWLNRDSIGVFLISHPSIEIRNDEIFLSIRVHPKSSVNRIDVSDFSIDIYVKEPADKGKANRSLLSCLAKTYKIPSSSLSISRGLKSRNKIIVIRDQNNELLFKKIIGKLF